MTVRATAGAATRGKRMSAEERRESILAAALHVFVERSYRGATTADIARAAKCNEALIFRHFGSKTGLFVETLELATRLICLEADAGAAGGGPGLDALQALAQHKSQHPDGRYRDLARIRFVAGTETADPEIAQALQRHLDVLHDWTAAKLREAKEAGQLADGIDPDVSAWQWSSAVTMTSLRQSTGDERAASEYERMARAMIDAWRR